MRARTSEKEGGEKREERREKREREREMSALKLPLVIFCLSGTRNSRGRTSAR